MADLPVHGPDVYDPIFGPARPKPHHGCPQCLRLEERLESARAHIRYLEATFAPLPQVEPWIPDVKPRAPGQLPEAS